MGRLFAYLLDVVVVVGMLLFLVIGCSQFLQLRRRSVHALFEFPILTCCPVPLCARYSPITCVTRTRPCRSQAQRQLCPVRCAASHFICFILALFSVLIAAHARTHTCIGLCRQRDRQKAKKKQQQQTLLLRADDAAIAKPRERARARDRERTGREQKQRSHSVCVRRTIIACVL